jgi:hypothetical protein
LSNKHPNVIVFFTGRVPTLLIGEKDNDVWMFVTQVLPPPDLGDNSLQK